MAQSVAYSGSVSSAVTDGSVVYSVTFPAQVDLVQGLTLQIVGGVTWGGYRVDTNTFNLTPTGFQFTVTGGLSPTVPAPVTVYWTVTGLSSVAYIPPTNRVPPGNALVPSTQPTTIITQQYTGNVGSVVTDGSVTYTAYFPTPSFINLEAVAASIVGGAVWGSYTLSVNVFNLTATSFQFTVTGGLSPTVPAPVTVYWTATGLTNNQYTNSDWTNRLLAELPNGWFPATAYLPGGIVYALLSGISTNLPFHNAQINTQTLQTRIVSATGGNLDAISADYFGTALPRLLGESDSSFRARILAYLIAPKSTLAAIQAAVNAYILENSPPYTVTVFDLMTSPAYCEVLGVVPYQFVIDLSYGVTSTTAWFMNDDPTGYLDKSTFLTGFSLVGAPDAGLDALIREVKAEGTEPVYAVLVGV